MKNIEACIKRLNQGNQSFVNNTRYLDTYSDAARRSLIENQEPFVTIITCSDSRIDPEKIFDLNLGEGFIIRNAGNIAEIETLSSVEYSVVVLKTPYIIVLGHSHCGAIEGAINNVHFDGPLNRVIHTISGRINGEKDEKTACLKNIGITMETISHLNCVKENNVAVKGAYYDIETGEVHFE